MNVVCNCMHVHEVRKKPLEKATITCHIVATELQLNLDARFLFLAWRHGIRSTSFLPGFLL